MGGLFRSEQMTYVELMMRSEAAESTVKHLGKWGKFHFVDLAFNKEPSERFQKYKKRYQNCQYWEKRLIKLQTLMIRNGVEPPKPDVQPRPLVYYADLLLDIEEKVDALEGELSTQLNMQEGFTKDFNSLVEEKNVLMLTRLAQTDARADSQGYRSFEDRVPLVGLGNDEEKSLHDDEGLDEHGTGLSRTMAGVIPVEKQGPFHRMIFRLSRGNAIVRFFPIPDGGVVTDPSTGERVQKTVFSIVYLGENLRRRIDKVCANYGATVYAVPSDAKALDRKLDACNTELIQKKAVLNNTNLLIQKILGEIAHDEGDNDDGKDGKDGKTGPSGSGRSGSKWLDWLHAVSAEKAMSDVFKKIEMPGRDMVKAAGWIPHDEVASLDEVLDEIAAATQSRRAVCQVVAHPKGKPPTYFKTNKFSSSFQGIVDTYGVPRYQEVNPGLFTIITFPFLFGVMYGDVLHGFCIFLAAVLMIAFEKRIQKMIDAGTLSEIPTMTFSGRYMLILMGAFGVYCGFIYNDCVSIPLPMFKSFWTFEGDNTEATAGAAVYPFGVDPTWYHTSNELAFFNSLKMKLSVALGVSQMIFGICLGLFNKLHFKDYPGIWFEFLPRIVFMMCTFGYMIFLIVYKFCVDWRVVGSGNAPNLVQTMIGMFLSPGHVDADKQLYQGQAAVQAVFLVLAFISVPIMLFGEPCWKKRKAGQAAAQARPRTRHGVDAKDADEETALMLDASSDVDNKEDDGHGHGHGHAAAGHDEDDGHGGSFSDQLITQGIHTIEFVLGAVSNTASYLRLWALSLAHSELSAVFWNKMIMQYGIQTGNPFMVFVGFSVWAAATGAVLLSMDVLECFLHALRLHWVEFQNKFFHADGFAFEPFADDNLDYKTIVRTPPMSMV